MATTSMDYEATGERYDGKSPVARLFRHHDGLRVRVVSTIITLYRLRRLLPTTTDQC